MAKVTDGSHGHFKDSTSVRIYQHGVRPHSIIRWRVMSLFFQPLHLSLTVNLCSARAVVRMRRMRERVGGAGIKTTVE